ncbi:MAG: urease accessory protein UreE [Mangrovicoccus sp.]|nr:urease accessory protein UreE [Mangrovicoccus sp.]
MTDSLPSAHEIVSAEPGDPVIALNYEERLLRRKRLETPDGEAFLVDLPAVRDVQPGQAFLLSTGGRIAVQAADQALVEIRGDLPRLAWHIGNRHTPCQIAGDHLVIAADHVLEAMLEGLGAKLTAITGPFAPEGGAYGHGRTMGHSHD